MKIYYKHIGVEYIARSIFYALRALNIKCNITTEIDESSDELYIVLIKNGYLDKIPKRFILFQNEQSSYLSEESDIDAYWITEEYYAIMNKAIEVWDYSHKNIDIFKEKVNQNVIFRYIPYYFSLFVGFYFNP